MVVYVRLMKHRADQGAGKATSRPDDSIQLWDVERAERLMMRLDGRLSNSKLEDTVKYPILLPRKAKLTELVIIDYHRREGHMGNMQVLAATREKFWIVGGVDSIRRAAWSANE